MLAARVIPAGNTAGNGQVEWGAGPWVGGDGFCVFVPAG